MSAKSKKKLIARTLGIGAGRIVIKSMDDIKEAITRQDIKDLEKQGVIAVKEIRGRRRVEKRKRRRRMGKIRKKVKRRKKDYIIMVRKLRSYLKQLRSRNKMDGKKYHEIRRKIKARSFKSLGQMIEHLGVKGEKGIQNEKQKKKRS